MYRRLAEWHKNKTIWLAWPFDKTLWKDQLPHAQKEFLELVSALKNERLEIIFATNEDREHATNHKTLCHLSTHVLPYGDIWLRDTFPIFVKDCRHKPLAVIPTFNGWGNKYLFDDDQDLATRAADLLGIEKIFTSLVFEGGGIDCDGQGTLLTTEQCLLNAHRNPQMTKKDIEKEFHRLFGIEKTIWLKEGLKNDHTDGHIDTIARFIAPCTVAIMTPRSPTDPNFLVLTALKNKLAHETDALGRPLNIVELPSPGAVTNERGELLPASYLNFIMGDNTLVVPLYGTLFDDEAVRIFASSVELNVVGLSAKAILSGGGAFHCISQEFYE